MKKIRLDFSALMVLFGVGIMSAHYFKEFQLMDVLIYIYCFFSACLLISTIPIINVAFNEYFMITMVMPLVFSKMTKEDAIEMVNSKSFISVPLVWNIACGIYFISRVKNEYLIMAFICVIFYYRVVDLIFRESMVRHLNYLNRFGL